MRKNTNRHKLDEPFPSAEVKKLLKVGDVADILGVSPVKVYDLLKNGLPSVKIDGARRIQPDKLQAWIEQHCA
ncbi:MAG TPA: helix-turn-helix domain-containing protein [Ktedonobacteraceae bacterium]|nr:helix-turn-helix domain-containing protein [Ktedonobacteraceae bacterium]